MADYSRQINTAYRLISKAGRAISITREAKGTYDPDTSSVSDGSTTVFEFQGVSLPATQGKIEAFEVRYVANDDLINREIRFLILSAKDSTFTPKQNDKVNVDGDVFSIIGVTKLSINGQDILYRMGVWK